MQGDPFLDMTQMKESRLLNETPLVKGLVQFRAVRTVQLYKSRAHQSCVLQRGSITKVLALLTAGSRQRPFTLSTRHTCHRKRDQEAKALSMSRQSYFFPIFVDQLLWRRTFFGCFFVHRMPHESWMCNIKEESCGLLPFFILDVI